MDTEKKTPANYLEFIRGHVGHREIFLAFSSVVLHDEQGRILLQRRADFDIWGLPGGILELGETIEACARRELYEETGLTAGELRLVGVYSDPRYRSTYPNGDRVQQFTICFAGVKAGGVLTSDGMETTDLRFFPAAEIDFDRLPSFYAAMVYEALAGGPPAFRPPYCEAETTDQVALMRSFIGHAPFIGVGAIAVVVDAKRRILLTHRIDDGEWCLPGGFSNLGENAACTAIREIREETGLEIEIERLMGVFSPDECWLYPNGDRTQALGCVFRAHPVGGSEQVDGVETEALAWLAPEELLRSSTHPWLQRMHRAVVAHLDAGWFLV